MASQKIAKTYPPLYSQGKAACARCGVKFPLYVSKANMDDPDDSEFHCLLCIELLKLDVDEKAYKPNPDYPNY